MKKSCRVCELMKNYLDGSPSKKDIENILCKLLHLEAKIENIEEEFSTNCNPVKKKAKRKSKCMKNQIKEEANYR